MLDTANEADFDDIVALASQICDVPVSLISLVDDDRQWFKAQIGFEPSETPLDQSVCSHAILQNDIVEIPDMSDDPRTVENSLHTDGPQVKFYAGANLLAPNGHAIGTLCVLDTKPRKLSDFQRQALKTLSRQVMMQLELRKKIKIEEGLRSEIDHRVKNSLQTIASILRMAARDVTDQSARDVLVLVERRLGAVASLHSELMGANGTANVNTTSYMEQISNLVTAIVPDTVTLSIETETGELEARKASALGMIVSEFVANSVKHAFPDGRAGRIDVTLTHDGTNKWVLLCSDNGVGQQPKEQSAEDTGLGSMLMSTAALQLDGNSETQSGEDGTRLRVVFTG